ncbi:hypothetical protein B0T10DRAFT_499798 [Thelonectria olida]|uniref:Uncharacterized protein n=1 Tax=Thelonectria olida TaxID=1576542 RepID=A0A9P9AJ84_9HYPO|nr:hypothetical protein B0T10DRAFT_499798 [Thelonectria olida]
MFVPRALMALAIAGAVVAGDMMTVWIPGPYGAYYNYPVLEGSLVHRNDSATTVTLNCRFSRTEMSCDSIEGVTFTFGPSTAGYNFAGNSTIDADYVATAESQTCKVRNWTPYDCAGAWTDYSGTGTTTGAWQLEYSYSVYYPVDAYITGYSSYRRPAITTPHSRTTHTGDSWPTPTSESAEDDEGDDNDGPHTGVIAGAVVGSVVGVALIGFCMVLLVRRRRAASPPAALTEPTGLNPPIYESANSDTIVHVGSEAGPLPPTYEAVLEEGGGVRK